MSFRSPEFPQPSRLAWSPIRVWNVKTVEIGSPVRWAPATEYFFPSSAEYPPAMGVGFELSFRWNGPLRVY